MNFKKQIFKMLLNKRQRAIIWQAILFSEHTYRRRGNVNGAATVQTVINETEKTFGFDKCHFTKEEVDNIVAGVLNDGKAHIEEAFRKGSEVAEKKMNEAYNAGFKRCLDEIENLAAKKEENEDNAAKHVKFHISEIDLSECKDKKEALEKALSIIAADLIGGNEKSDDNEDNDEKDKETSNEDVSEDSVQNNTQSDDKTKEQ